MAYSYRSNPGERGHQMFRRLDVPLLLSGLHSGHLVGVSGVPAPGHANQSHRGDLPDAGVRLR
jgi:hypothetical protein